VSRFQIRMLPVLVIILVLFHSMAAYARVNCAAIYNNCITRCDALPRGPGAPAQNFLWCMSNCDNRYNYCVANFGGNSTPTSALPPGGGNPPGISHPPPPTNVGVQPPPSPPKPPPRGGVGVSPPTTVGNQQPPSTGGTTTIYQRGGGGGGGGARH
jgi:hypothetical protein